MHDKKGTKINRLTSQSWLKDDEEEENAYREGEEEPNKNDGDGEENKEEGEDGEEGELKAGPGGIDVYETARQ